MKEIWRTIEEYESYQVSNLGRVRSLDRVVKTKILNVSNRVHKGKILKLTIQNNGYVSVRLCKDGKSKKFWVHRLVGMAFQDICGEWFEGAVINHKDENPSNNIATNLEWCTQKYNMNYNDVMKVKVAPKLRKTEEEKIQNRKEYLEKTKEHRKERLHNWYLEHRQLKGTTNKKPVLQYTLDGQFIREWESATLAYNTIMNRNGDSGSGICRCCKGKLKTAYGYKWEYKDVA